MITLLPDITDAPGKTTRGSFLSPRAAVFTVISKKAFAKLVSANGLEKPERVVAEKEKSGLVIASLLPYQSLLKKKKKHCILDLSPIYRLAAFSIRSKKSA
jgi:hypothetical protein